jgi:hypothetical protein
MLRRAVHTIDDQVSVSSDRRLNSCALLIVVLIGFAWGAICIVGLVMGQMAAY